MDQPGELDGTYGTHSRRWERHGESERADTESYGGGGCDCERKGIGGDGDGRRGGSDDPGDGLAELVGDMYAFWEGVARLVERSDMKWCVGLWQTLERHGRNEMK